MTTSCLEPVRSVEKSGTSYEPLRVLAARAACALEESVRGLVRASRTPSCSRRPATACSSHRAWRASQSRCHTTGLSGLPPTHALAQSLVVRTSDSHAAAQSTAMKSVLRPVEFSKDTNRLVHRRTCLRPGFSEGERVMIAAQASHHRCLSTGLEDKRRSGGLLFQSAPWMQPKLSARGLTD
jgi:hypothetical protein